MIEIIKNANLGWLAYFKTKHGLIGLFISLTLTILFIRPNNPVALTIVIFSMCFGLYIASLLISIVEAFFARKQKILIDRLEQPQNLKWSVYNHNGIKIGEIDELDYYKEKYASEASWSVLFKQILNIIFIPITLIFAFFRTLPLALLCIVIFFTVVEPSFRLENLTLGRILVFTVDHKAILINLLFISLVVMMGLLALFGKPVPGYINYYGLELQKRLSAHLPLLAAVDGFSVVGYKVHDDGQIELPNTGNATK